MKLTWNLAKIWKIVMIPRRVYRSRQRNMIISAMLLATFCLLALRIMTLDPYTRFRVLGGRFAALEEVNELVHTQIKKSILKEKGTGCKVPPLELYSEEAMAFITDFKDTHKIVCQGNDWVDCHKSECYVKEQILRSMRKLVCTYSDIVYVDDHNYYLGEPVSVPGAGKYALNRSDHVKISCSATDAKGLGVLLTRWDGYKSGFRPVALKIRPQAHNHSSFNVMVLAFDSVSHNSFLRHMPESYKYLSEELDAVILDSYSIVGDGTSAALFPVFTGKSETEQPDTRKTIGKGRYIDHTAFIFHHLKEIGYRTAYFEDMPWIGTFTYRFNGFRHQPAEHYLRSFYMELFQSSRTWWGDDDYDQHCIGETSNYQFLLDHSTEFLDLDGKKFCFTFIADITHDNINLMSNADSATAHFLQTLRDKQVLEDTLVIVMGDHGSRYGNIRNTYQGRLEERLPLMAIILPEQLKKRRPSALEALRHNRDVLTTHFDLHATLLDAVDLKQYANDYKEPGADIPRSMSLLEKIPKSRTCGEAGVIPHWCVCTDWRHVSAADPKYAQVAKAMADYINSISNERRDKCAVRELISIEWVMRQDQNVELLTTTVDLRHEYYFGQVGTERPKPLNEYYQAKIVLSPGRAVFEGTLVYNVKVAYFYVTEKDISRTSAYGDEPACVSATHPHLNKFCFCKDKLNIQEAFQPTV